MSKLWHGKRYNSVNAYLKEAFGEKAFKVSIDAGFTCPNRDGSVSTGGCTFCSERGSGDFTGTSVDLVDQFRHGVELMTRKWKSGRFIVYFQAFTNTYAPVTVLREKYELMLTQENVAGLAIATRPDCLGDEVIELLRELNAKTYLWVELGLQTSREDVAQAFNRGYGNQVYENAVSRLHAAGIRFVTHVIFGLPGETTHDMLNTIEYVSASRPWGVKLHLLHLMKGTRLERVYEAGGIQFLTKDEYIDLVVNALERLPEETVIHRLTGDSPRQLLIGPEWSLNKWEILNAIDDELEQRDTWQGKRVSEGEVRS